MDGVRLLEPRWLYLLLLLPLVWSVALRSLSDLPRPQRIAQAALRSLVLCALALALARPSREGYETRVCTVFAVDVSDSVTEDQLAKAKAFVEQAVAARGENDVRARARAPISRPRCASRSRSSPPIAFAAWWSSPTATKRTEASPPRRSGRRSPESACT
jgi:hypothetical protein